MPSMSVQPIRPISFSGRRTFSPEEFAKLSDEQLYGLAVKANKGFARKNNMKANAYFYGAPIIASSLIGAASATGGGLVGRTASALKNAGSWGGFFAVLALSNLALKGVSKTVKPVGDFEKKHPILSLVAHLGVVLGAWSAAVPLFNKTKALVANKLPNMVQKFTNLKGQIANALTSSKINTHIYQPIAKKTAGFLAKHPTFTKIASKSAPYLLLASVFYGIYKAAVKKEEIIMQENRNFFALKMMSNSVKSHLASREV